MGTLVTTKYGNVRGTSSEGVCKWLGIPFAKPPVGELRFRRAVEPDPWQGDFDATNPGNSPVQFAAGPPGMEIKPKGTESEDCLYLNVFAPDESDTKTEPPTGGYPVFVWFYGGAFHIGEINDPSYQLVNMAKKGIVCVTANYRLGPLGFYDFSEFSDRFDSNCAVSDAIAALKWVNSNIEAFGGNPQNVTICGESAGGTMVYAMLGTHASDGLFSKAISMSGLPANIQSREEQYLFTNLFLQELGLDHDSVDNLSEMCVKKIQAAAKKEFNDYRSCNNGALFAGPTIDGDYFDKPVWDLLAEGSAKGVDCLIGTCRDEGQLFTMSGEAPNTWEKLEQMFVHGGYPDAYEPMRKLYGDGKSDKEALDDLATDKMFWVDNVRCMLAQIQYANVWCYRFDYVPPEAAKVGFGATHSMDVSPGLDTYDDDNPAWYPPDEFGNREKIRDYLNGSFVGMCKDGSPCSAAPVEWPKFYSESRSTMCLSLDADVTQNSNRERFDAWDGIYLYK